VFISFEGHDGSGKTTQAALLADWLRADGHEVVATREPGGTPLGEAIRDVVLHGREMTPWAEATLFASARAEHVHKVIRPALERGAWVICDRYIDSSIVYQGIARGLGVEAVLELNRAVTGGLMPERTFVLVLEADAARERQANAYLDRIERESEDFRRIVADGYRELAILFPRRVAVLDAALPADTIAEQVREQVRRLPVTAVPDGRAVPDGNSLDE
jgi:dTMP kinase